MITVAKAVRVADYSGIDIGPFSIDELKIRLQSKYFPDYTIDMSKKAPTAKKGSFLNLMQPKATIFVGSPVNKAYDIDPITKSIKRTSPAVFNTPTTLDKIMNIGILPFAIAALGGGLFIFKTIKKRRLK